MRLRNQSHNLVYLPESKIPLDEKLLMLKLAGNGVLGLLEGGVDTYTTFPPIGLRALLLSTRPKVIQANRYMASRVSRTEPSPAGRRQHSAARCVLAKHFGEFVAIQPTRSSKTHCNQAVAPFVRALILYVSALFGTEVGLLYFPTSTRVKDPGFALATASAILAISSGLRGSVHNAAFDHRLPEHRKLQPGQRPGARRFSDRPLPCRRQ
jgi:hypothetical protein